MKAIVSLKRVFTGLAGVGALTVLALAAQAQIPPMLGNLPLYFEAVAGAAGHPAQFVARGGDYRFLISPTGVQFTLEKADAATRKVSLRTVRMDFVGADSHAQVQGADELPGKINYLVGSNPAHWRTGVATFARVRVPKLYPGINLVYYGNQRRLEYDFTLAPGADPSAIGIRFDGVDKISAGPRGELILTVGKAQILQPAPMIYQTIDGARKIIHGGYRIVGRHTVAFTVGQFDHQRPLVIDPILSFSTYFGGNAGDIAWSVALDTNDGSIYIAGQTLSKTFYYTPGAFQTNFAGGSFTGDAFVAKFDQTGTNLIYLTYLGGKSDDAAYSIAVNGAGNAYVTGETDSRNFPVTNSIPGGVPGLPNSMNISGTVGGNGYYPGDAFVTELGPGGSNLVYSTYLGGSDTDVGTGIAVDSVGNAYVTGATYSTNFPTTSLAFQKHLGCTNWAYQAYYNANAFVTEIAANGTNLLYSSYFGGTNYGTGESIAVDSSDHVYVAGFTASTNFPTTNAFQAYLNGATNLTTAYDAFVAEFMPSCTGLVYSTFLGGTNNDVAYHIAADNLGNAYVTGWTVSTNFPNTATNVPGLYNGLANNGSGYYPHITNAFLTKIIWNGTNAAIGYSAVFGGTNGGMDVGRSVALDPVGDAFVVGSSSSTTFPVTNTPGLLSATKAGGSDAFVIGFNTNCSAVLYSGYLGGSGNDYGYGIAVDAQTNVYLAGQTASKNFPAFHPFQSTLKGGSDAFLAEIGWVNEKPEITDQSSLTNQLLETGQSVTFAVTATGTPPLSYHWQLNGTNLANNTRISGATNATLTIYPVQTNDSGSYHVVVTNFAGSVTSTNAILTVTSAPLITMQPTNQTVGVGDTAQFSSRGYATAPYFFQWYKDGVDLTNGTNNSGSVISGATNVTLTIQNVQTNDAGEYWFTLTNKWGSVISTNVVLTVVAFPTITAAPTNQTVGLGSAVTFSVSAMGALPMSYQWQKNGNNLANSGHISGATGSALTIHSAQTVDDGSYSVIITNVEGSVTSSPPAVLTVLSSPLFGNITTGANGGFILSGVGGLSGGIYYVLTSTNLATPLGQWTPIATNQFGSQGQFTFTNAPSTNAPQQFYLLQQP